MKSTHGVEKETRKVNPLGKAITWPLLYAFPTVTRDVPAAAIFFGAGSHGTSHSRLIPRIDSDGREISFFLSWYTWSILYHQLLVETSLCHSLWLRIYPVKISCLITNHRLWNKNLFVYLLLQDYHYISHLHQINSLYTFSLQQPLICYLIFLMLVLVLKHWKSIHLEVALESFCFLINSSWLLTFTLIIITFIFTGFNLYCWTGIHFS